MAGAGDSVFPYPPDGDTGIDVRTYAAVHIAAGIASIYDLEVADNLDDTADVAVRLADALLRRLNAPAEGPVITTEARR